MSDVSRVFHDGDFLFVTDEVGYKEKGVLFLVVGTVKQDSFRV